MDPIGKYKVMKW